MCQVFSFEEMRQKYPVKSAKMSMLPFDPTGMTEGEIVCRINMLNSKIRESKLAADKARRNDATERSYKLDK
jgi:hypothetical protein